MQKKIIALAIAAAFAAPVAATADSMFYGSMDGGVRHQSNEGAAGTTFSMKMGQYNTARWGFKASDDLGDGMKANVVLETSFTPAGVGTNSDMGTTATAATSTGTSVTLNPASTNPFGLIFDRQATVGMEGGWGKFDMGWNYTTSFKTIATYDPMKFKFLGVALAKGADHQDRAGNVVYSNTMGGMTVMAEYMINDAFQSRAANYAGTGRALGVTYAEGDINVGASYTAQESAISDSSTGAAIGYDKSSTHMTAGAGYNYGAGKAYVGYAKKATKNAATAPGDNTATNMWLGADYNVSDKVQVTGAYYSKVTNTGLANANDATTKVTMAMATYAMTKKTTLYVEADRKVENAGGTALDVVTSGFSAGLDVKF